MMTSITSGDAAVASAAEKESQTMSEDVEVKATSSGGAAVSSVGGRKKERRTMMQEVEEALAQSMLVFLLADLRLMSATGRVKTKYETIAIASDPPTRSTAVDLAGLDPDNTHDSMVHNQQEGMSPAQIMAVVLLELTKTVEDRRRREAERELAEAAGLDGPIIPEEDVMTFQVDKKTGTMKFAGQNDDIHALLKAYADMIGQDLKNPTQRAEKRMSMVNLNPEDFKVHEEEEEDEEKEDTGNENIGQAAVEAMGKVAEGTREQMQRAKARRQSIMQGMQAKKEAKTTEQFGELTDALYRQGVGNRHLRTSLAQSLGRRKRHYSQQELTSFVQDAVDSREYGKLDFLAGLFKDGTVSKFMAESKARIVWMNDWYPLKDLTYCIAVDPQLKRVLVVFRGAITSQDWSRAVQSRNFCEVPNPIDEDYDKKTDTINMSIGFYEYLFRVRKDTGTKKYDEIANLAYKYAKERIGDDFELVVNGHSLGGALSTVFSFYASTDDRFTQNGPVKCFNFGAPYVGGKKFMRAFHHQELSQHLLFGRFFNHNDIVAHLPPNMQVTKVRNVCQQLLPTFPAMASTTA